jgi:hypothetical protein
MPQPNAEIVERVRSEFMEWPGLRLTPSQAQKLWGLQPAECAAVLQALEDAAFLYRNRDGAFTLRQR